MNFQETEARFRWLEGQLAAGTLNEQTYHVEMGKLQVQDEWGRWWAMQERTGQWHIFQDGHWIPAMPPAPFQLPVGGQVGLPRMDNSYESRKRGGGERKDDTTELPGPQKAAEPVVTPHLHCGKPVSSTIGVAAAPLQWEYKERYIEMKKRDGSYVWFDASDSIAKDLHDVWTGGWENQIRSYLTEDLEQGWEIDPTVWGPSCIQHESKGLGPTGWHLGYWIGYILLSVMTAFIGLFILPFIMKRPVVVLHGAKIGLRRLKQS